MLTTKQVVELESLVEGSCSLNYEPHIVNEARKLGLQVDSLSDILDYLAGIGSSMSECPVCGFVSDDVYYVNRDGEDCCGDCEAL